MTDDKPIREYDRFIIRLPDGMRERIAQSAATNGRSMNAEIVAILTATLHVPDYAAVRELRQDQKHIVEEIDETNTKLRALRAKRDAIGLQISKKLNLETQIDQPAREELDEIAWAMKDLRERRDRVLREARARQGQQGDDDSPPS